MLAPSDRRTPRWGHRSSHAFRPPLSALHRIKSLPRSRDLKIDLRPTSPDAATAKYLTSSGNGCPMGTPLLLMYGAVRNMLLSQPSAVSARHGVRAHRYLRATTQ